MSDRILYEVDFDIVEDWGLRKGEAVAHVPEWMVEAVPCVHGSPGFPHIIKGSIRHQPVSGITKWDECNGKPEADK